MIRSGLVILFLIAMHSWCHAQNVVNRFAKIDSIAIKVNAKSLDTVTQLLTQSCNTDIEKVRSIFVWIAHHVAYDTKVLAKGYRFTPYSFSYINSEDSAKKEARYHSDMADSAFKTRKAICMNYACLFKKMLSKVSIKSHVITGYARIDVEVDAFEQDSSNHAWNAVWMDRKWYLFDVTWASGYVDYKALKFHKEFNEHYFLVKPKELIASHFPDEPQWQMIDTPISRLEFSNQLFVSSEYFKEEINAISPNQAVVELSKNHPVFQVKIATKDTSCFFKLQQKPFLKKRTSLTNNIDDDFLEIENPRVRNTFHKEIALTPNAKFVDVYFNFMLVATYKIKWVQE